MPVNKYSKSILPIIGILAGTLVPAAPADAVARPGGDHCVLGGPKSNVAIRCFATFRQAVTFASGRQITNAPQTARDAIADSGFRKRLASTQTASGEVIAATAFDESNYRGSTLTMVAPHPCTKNGKLDWWYDLSATGWTNRISSVQPWANCWIWLYPESGDRDGPFKTNTPDVGAYINNRAFYVGLS